MESKPETVEAEKSWPRFSIADLACFMLGIGFVFAMYASEFKGLALAYHVILLSFSVTALGLLFSAVPILLRQVYLRRSWRLTPGEIIWACYLTLWLCVWSLPSVMDNLTSARLLMPEIQVMAGLVGCLAPLVYVCLVLFSIVILYQRWSAPVRLSLPWTDTFALVLSLTVNALLLVVVLMNVFL